ncbi:glycosyltransferase [Yoonia vestfoldensis]|uniref:glycosyltransferase n=1 Tax=Yoonia vestfoldensis TaxID=245188 RepID=UPI00035D37D3|nr:glycosyltransferase [Yoonia vestfoldensis]
MNVRTQSDKTSFEAVFLKEPRLSVIVPFRDEGRAPWFLTRLEELCQSFPRQDDLEFVVVDSGSVREASKACRAICARADVSYLYHDSAGQAFSIGQARDFGAIHAQGRAITFLDVDFRVPHDFWTRLLVFMKSYGISDYKKRFFVVPALYLTEEGTDEFRSIDDDARFQDFYLRWMHGDTRSIQNLAPCSSIIVVDRFHYLAIGGHNPIFKGHGFEDFELLHRLAEDEGRFPRPDVYLKDTKSWETATYNGFRSRLALFGRPALLSNLFVVHLWHPRPKTLSFYDQSHMKSARDVGPRLLGDFDKNRDHPTPIAPAINAHQTFLVLGEPRTNVTRCMRDVYPHLGRPVFVKETDLVMSGDDLGSVDLTAFVTAHGIGLMLINSPYANPVRKAIYDWCRASGFPYFVFERGALPDSWFFDPDGFNADSRSYDRRKWDKRISAEDRSDAAAYIHATFTGDAALERQGTMIGGSALGEKLRIGGRKVLFVPLQRPSDTVTTHMAGPAKSCGDFLQVIDATAALLKRAGWVVLCKRHPLETASPTLTHAQYVPEDTHFIDLLELADAVALINSGVGLYAMMMGKPCYIFGEAFYAFDGVNTRVADLDPGVIRDTILAGSSVDRESVLRFIHYLTKDFYSFGVARTAPRIEADGSRRVATREIDFYSLRVPGQVRLTYKKEIWPHIPLTAPLFERYKLDIVQKNNARKAAPVSTPSHPAPEPRPQQTPSAEFAAVLPKQDRRIAKLAKLRRSPHAFFRDAKNPALRQLSHVFRSR